MHIHQPTAVVYFGNMTTTEKEQKLGEWQRQWRILAETINAGWCAARRNSCHLKVNDSPDSTLNSGKGAVQLGCWPCKGCG